MNIVGIARIRNEAGIIEHTLEHLSDKLDAIYILDDCSTDNTVEICKKFPKVVKVLTVDEWESRPLERLRLEGEQRQTIYDCAVKDNPDWIYYFDADEYADFSDIDFEDESIKGYQMRFFDYYITEEDVEKHYLERENIGPEYRDILTLFRPNPNIKFLHRTPVNVGDDIVIQGYVKHYGKSISVQQWEDTCNYYINHLFEPQPGGTTISDKWEKRKGKAIHEESDFGNDFIEWRDRNNPDVIIDNSKGQAEL